MPSLLTKELCILLFPLLFSAQTYLYAQADRNDSSWQDSLLQLGFKMYNEPNEPERLEANYAFIKTLVQLLKQPYSFDKELDTLRMISIKKSTDDVFRIFSWHLTLADGSYRYYGAIQFKTTDGRLSLQPLVDQSHMIEDPIHALTDNNHWYGAQYYEIVPLGNPNKHYVLLGWKGSTPEITQKTIDILDLSGPEISFGKALFKGKGVDIHATRMIYQYNAHASMLLKYEPQHDRIVMDHLAPADSSLAGQFKHYGPDMSYDAWKIEHNSLNLLEDLPLQNNY